MRALHGFACFVLVATFAAGGCNAIFGIEVIDPLPTGSGGSGATGGGGYDCTTLDVDEDGYDACNDCEDGNADVHPGQDEICGNDIDDNCDGDVDEACGGLGTYVSSIVGKDENPGTQGAPVATIAKALEHAASIGNGQDVFVGEGAYNEQVTMAEGTSILGGHCCTALGDSCSWMRDRASCASTLTASEVPVVFAGPSLSNETELSGFTISGPDLGTVSPEAYATVEVTGALTIALNIVIGPDVACSTSGCLTAAVHVSGDGGSSITGNTIEGGDSSNGKSTALWMSAGGFVGGNTLLGASGRWVRALEVWLQGSLDLKVNGNILAAGTCVGSDSGISGAFLSDTAGGGKLTFERNDVNYTHGSSACGSCPDGFPCAGVDVTGDGTVWVKSNIIKGIDGVPFGAALALTHDSGPMGEIIINANTLVAPEATTAAAVATWTEEDGSITGGELRNNIFASGTGIYEGSGGGRQFALTLVEHNAFHPDATTRWRQWDGSNSNLLQSLSDINALPNAASNIDDTCNLDATYHLTSSSDACIDVGTIEDAPSSDIDGDDRPTNDVMDLGADEFIP